MQDLVVTVMLVKNIMDTTLKVFMSMEQNLNPEILKILAIIPGFFRWYRKYSLRITEIY